MILASFNYSGPNFIAVGAALALAVAVATLTYFVRSIVFGLIIGILYGGIASWIVIGMGVGDMTEMLQMVYSPMLGGIGGVVGAVVAAIGKRRSSSPPAKPNNRLGQR